MSALDLSGNAQTRERVVAGVEEAEERVVALIESGRAINLPALFDVLAALRTERAANILFDRLITGPEGVSHAAATALAAHPSPHAREALQRASQRADVDPAVRTFVARLLEKMGTSDE